MFDALIVICVAKAITAIAHAGIESERATQRGIVRWTRAEARRVRREMFDAHADGLREYGRELRHLRLASAPLIGQVRTIITATRRLSRDPRLPSAARIGQRASLRLMEQAASRVNAWRGPYLSNFYDQVRDCFQDMRVGNLSSPDVPASQLPEGYPTVGLLFQANPREWREGGVALGYGQWARLAGATPGGYPLLITGYDRDNGWTVSSALGAAAVAARDGSTVKARVIGVERWGMQVELTGPGTDVARASMPWRICSLAARTLRVGDVTTVFVHDCSWNGWEVEVSDQPPPRLSHLPVPLVAADPCIAAAIEQHGDAGMWWRRHPSAAHRWSVVLADGTDLDVSVTGGQAVATGLLGLELNLASRPVHWSAGRLLPQADAPALAAFITAVDQDLQGQEDLLRDPTPRTLGLIETIQRLEEAVQVLRRDPSEEAAMTAGRYARQACALDAFVRGEVPERCTTEERAGLRAVRRALAGLPVAPTTRGARPAGQTRPIDARLTPAQSEIVQRLRAGDPLILVQGPPGTGKTDAIAAAVADVLERCPQARVAIASQANVAVIEALAKLSSRYDSSRIRRVMSQKAREQAINAGRDVPETGDLSHVAVIGCTLAMLGSVVRSQPTFDLVIVDEAAKATIPEIAGALACSHQVVLVGDHRQLPPMVEPTLALDGGQAFFEHSLFERLWEDGGAPRTRILLDRHFRCRAPIAQAISHLFYDGCLQGMRDGESPIVASRAGLVWCDTGGEPGDVTREGKSLRSDLEADVIIDLLAHLPATARLRGKPSVAVIAGYAAQRTLLSQRLQGVAHDFASLDVFTIDATQGGQWDIVIIATTRCDGSAGFLAKPNRINVAISRGRELVIVVGSLPWARAPYLQRTAIGRLARYLVCAAAPGTATWRPRMAVSRDISGS